MVLAMGNCQALNSNNVYVICTLLLHECVHAFPSCMCAASVGPSLLIGMEGVREALALMNKTPFVGEVLPPARTIPGRPSASKIGILRGKSIVRFLEAEGLPDMGGVGGAKTPPRRGVY